MEKIERPLAYIKSQEISYEALGFVTGGANKASSRIDRMLTNTPTGDDVVVQVIPD